MKVLVIDDRQENREAAVRLLSDHEVTTVGSYNEAMDLITGKVDPRKVYEALGRPWHGGIIMDDEFNAKEAELEPKFDFDIVLIDLMMPASDRTLSDYNREHTRGAPMPYGFPLMIKVAMVHSERVKHIAIVSDVNHHNHAMSAALDPLGGYNNRSVTMNGIPCLFIHAHLQQDCSKDWVYALKRIVSPENVLIND